ncbi:C-C chemokine receptor type 8-like [Triplophysa rosa]|uniref:C-C chemokine receptor type 8-like n=1 Tax=Triplophysa rosa TaxID=992332 RepID=UPI00254614C8|nr:C-C chemokine receptor type 8-like [Triplophysa rosa]
MKNSTVNFTTSAALFESSDVLLRLHMSVHSINVLFGLPTHSFILWLIITSTGSGIASDFFNLNLSVCEIGICLNSVSVIFYSLWFSSLSGLVYFLSGLGITGRPLFQCLMCVERYLAVVHPVTFLKYKPLRYRLMCCTAAWIICLVSCFLCMFSVILLKYVLFIEFYSVQFLVFLSIQLFCCLAVLRALKQSGPGERVREREEENHMKRRAFHLILITTVNFLVIYLPFITLGFYFILSKHYILELELACLFVFSFASFVQPVLYLHRAGKLRSLCSP